LDSIGQGHRDVCLIPVSAHGTNPASAVMCGMKVVTVQCEESGNLDLEDLKKKLKAHEGKVACTMITYPSTYGVFEETIQTVLLIN
jgi:glycine dehydrogenase